MHPFIRKTLRNICKTEVKDINNKLDYGTEDNPEGTNKGTKREVPNESWIKYWNSFNEKQVKLITEDLEEEIDEEDEVKIIRGTEDNPIPDNRRPKIENY